MREWDAEGQRFLGIETLDRCCFWADMSWLKLACTFNLGSGVGYKPPCYLSYGLAYKERGEIPMEALGKAEHCLAASPHPLPNACGTSIQLIGSPFFACSMGYCLLSSWLLLGGYPRFFSWVWILTAEDIIWGMESKGMLELTLYHREDKYPVCPKGSGSRAMLPCFNLRGSTTTPQGWVSDCWSPKMRACLTHCMIWESFGLCPASVSRSVKRNNCSICLLGLLGGLNEMRHV